MTDLTKLKTSTQVTFPQGKTTGTSQVHYAQHNDSGKLLVIVEKTPFHPLSNSWPDQQADTGWLKVGDKKFAIVDSLTAAINLEGEEQGRLYLDSEIPSRFGTPGWRFFVAHVVEDPSNNLSEELIDKEVELEVDAERRLLLSAAHTSTHLAALALNEQAAHLWSKEVEKDGLGHPNLDKLAIVQSNIAPGKAIDRYRFGKSLRKKGGFDSSAFFENVTQISAAINRQLAEWIATDANVVIETEGSELEAKRSWTCTLNGKLVKFPCGGTHLTHLGELESIEISLESSPELQEMTMITVPKLKQ